MVPGCSNDSKRTKGKEISYHRLPRDNKLAKIWIEKTKRKNPPQPSSCYVCSEHFGAECFNRSLKFELAGQKEKKTLVLGAIPTIFKFNNSKEKRQRVFSIKRKQKQDRENVSLTTT